MAELSLHAVLQPFELPHCAAGEHEAFDEEGQSLGMVRCENAPQPLRPGDSVYLEPDQAALLVADEVVAPAGAEDVDVLLVKAAAKRYGLL